MTSARNGSCFKPAPVSAPVSGGGEQSQVPVEMSTPSQAEQSQVKGSGLLVRPGWRGAISSSGHG